MKCCYTLILWAHIALPSHASESGTSSWKIGAGVTFYGFESQLKSSDSIGYEASVGYQLSEQNLLLEAGYNHAQYSDGAYPGFHPLFTRFKTFLPVSDYASLYLGGGIAYDQNTVAPLLNTGVQYQLSEHVFADLGYQGAFGVDEDNLYALNISLSYRFYDHRTNATSSVVDVTPVNEQLYEDNKPAQAVSSYQPPEVPEKKCHVRVEKYRVAQGDFLLRIAHSLNRTLEQILNLNPSLSEDRDINIIYPGEVINY